MEQESAQRPPLLAKNDIVQSMDDPSKVGTILRTSSSPSDSSSDSDSDSDSTSDPPAGSSLVTWASTGAHEHIPNPRLALLDRRFSHADIVVSTSAPLAQSGFISALHVYAHVSYRQSDRRWEAPHVSTRELLRVRPLVEGDYVIRDHWLGRVDDVMDNVTLAFSDGAECKVIRADPDTLVCDDSETTEPMSYYYPGAVVRERAPASVYRRAVWTRGRWRSSRGDATVSRVDTSAVTVKWLSSGGTGGRSCPRPAEEQKPQDLARLPRFCHVDWDIGDRTLGTVPTVPSVPKVKPPQRRRKRAEVRCTGVVLRTKTYADVVWQDGTRGRDIPTTELQNSGPFNFNEFWPESYVVESVNEGEEGRTGVVKSVDLKQRTARVRWCNPVSSVRELLPEETVSIFELLDHPDYRYYLGDIVVRLTPAEEAESDESPDLSWVGYIVGYEDGEVEVEWADGVTSKAGPESVFVVYRPRDGDSDDEDDDDDARSWETVDEEEKMRILEVEEAGDEINEPEVAEEAPSSQGGAFSFVSGLAVKFVSALLGIRDKEEAASEPVVENGELAETSEGAEDKLGAEDALDEAEKKPLLLEEAEEEPEPVPVLPAVEPQDVSTLVKQFDVVSDAADHHFFHNTDMDIQTKKWLRTVHNEWSVLQNTLPETIYVRMYEDRMSLLRAVIIGAAGTPYEDGLFVFDFYLPGDYPYRPPSAHYHSYGMYLNPNLYADGKICLSLLNTWRGKDSEIWNPGSSNVLQVLLSIQGLVLNSKPYFNEADFDRYVGTDGGEKNSIEYNESAFILTCKSTLNLLRRPPKHLEELIKSHFRSRGAKILSTCKAYCNGVPVGATAEEYSGQNIEAPAGFKLLLVKLMPMLASAFTAIGASGCEEFLAAS